MTSLAPAHGTTGASLTPTLSGIARDRVGGGLTAHFYVRSDGSASWNVANGAQVAVTSGSRASYRILEGRLQPARRTSGACGPVTRRVCAAAGHGLRFSARAA
jgi:hypothetical protein